MAHPLRRRRSLIFMNLARYLNDRPVYAVRARGLDGELHITSLDELITTYHSAIKRKRPEGPYAIAGYAFGGIPAFEIAKRMESRKTTALSAPLLYALLLYHMTTNLNGKKNKDSGEYYEEEDDLPRLAKDK
ncbi:hypothetical protein IFR05_012734 [Cadophora sp. M221]|nr:hypothetical protein IFR05_012734 [Cadophora sp. M221]